MPSRPPDLFHPSGLLFGLLVACGGAGGPADQLAPVCLAQTREVPAHHATIQAAIEAAGPCDVIVVAAGRYAENIDFLSKPLAVRGAGIGLTVLDGQSNGTSVVQMGAGARLEDLTVTNGAAGYGAGVSMSGRPVGTLSRVEVTGNTSTGSGGGVGARGAIIEDSIISANVAAGDGGGLRCQGCLLSDVTLSHNAAAKGGGAYLEYWDQAATIGDTVVTGNVAAVAAGLFVQSYGTALDVTNLTVQENSVDGMYYFAMDSASLAVTGLVLERNGGEALRAQGFDISNQGVLLDRVLAVDNKGTAVHLAPSGSAPWTLSRATVVGTGGDAVEDSDGNPRVGAITTSILAYSAGAGVYCAGTRRPKVTLSDVYHNRAGNYVEMADRTGAEGNISVDPQFMLYSPDIDSSRWDLHLATTSPLLDAGGDGSDPDGTTADIGYYSGSDAEFDYYLDLDGDTLYDGWELEFSLDDAEDDADADGLENGEEFTRRTDPRDADTDDDGAGDADEAAAGTDPLDASST